MAPIKSDRSIKKHISFDMEDGNIVADPDPGGRRSPKLTGFEFMEASQEDPEIVVEASPRSAKGRPGAGGEPRPAGPRR